MRSERAIRRKIAQFDRKINGPYEEDLYDNSLHAVREALKWVLEEEYERSYLN
jgi:hypothetical protein